MTDSTTYPVPPLTIEYDAANDHVTINGVKYSGEVFRTLVFPDTRGVYSFERDGAKVAITKHGTKKDFGLK